VAEPATDGEESSRGTGRGLYSLLRHGLAPVVSRVFRPVVEGEHHVPRHGPAILAANHLSFSDWVFLPMATSRRITFVAKSDYFTRGGVRGWVQKRFCAGTGLVPIDRSGGTASASALQAGLKVLRRGELFGIFPEGTRSPDGRLYRGRTGVARLALRSGAPVVPVGLVGTDTIAPPGRVLSRVVSPTIRFGEPLHFGRYRGMEDDRFVLRSITDEIMYAVMELTGQEYVDEYVVRGQTGHGR
jgi:1-acyl-sn-glycerol-3-phosphate acyltransferase